MKKIVLFGAGKIGRSFIGQLFSRGGYEVVFIDVDEKIINALNDQKSYRIIIKGDEGNRELIVKNVRGIPASDHEKVNQELSGTNITATAVGPANLPGVIASMAAALQFRFKEGNWTPLDIIIAENLRDAAHFFYEEFCNYMTPDRIERSLGLVETSIGKMVPIMSHEDIESDPLMVFAEPYNTLILDKKGFKNSMPDIPGLAPKENMKAWVDRKSFIHNLGHAAAAYYGYLYYPGKRYLYEVLSDDRIFSFTKSVMQQSATALIKKYPGEFTEKELNDHIEDLIRRFRNKALGDTIFRVGLDIYRKLSPQDRLAGAIRLCLENNTEYNKILYALICGCYFKATDEAGRMYPGDKEFSLTFKEKRLEYILEKVSNFNKYEHQDIYKQAEKMNEDIIKEFKVTIEGE